ncbi:MAG: nucleotidyl transferase AbiEii/AbiGii toxin family protein, partial [Trebonia sp.]
GMLRTLVAHHVRFVIIGGFAVSLHGYVRATKDIDIVPAPDAENMSRLWDALHELDARPAELGEFAPGELPAPFSQGLVEGGGNRIVYTRLGRIDLVLHVEDADGEVPYDELRAAADSEEFEEVNGVLWFASAEHLIAMKLHAGRDEDLRDVTALRRALGIQDD